LSSVQSLPKVCEPALTDTARWLTLGGDERILPSGSQGRNRYGCPPYPDPGVLAFGSSTASIISPQAYAAVDRLRSNMTDDARWRAHQLKRQGDELAALLGIEDLEPEVVLGPSGTDMHRLAVQLIRKIDGRHPACIMAEGAETGSGVPAALAGGEGDGPIIPVRLRDDRGEPRAPAEVNAEAEEAAIRLDGQGHHCLLVITDVSKTGLLGPDMAMAARLQQRLSGRLRVLVDACQMRLSARTLRTYLNRGFWVILTGSKFLSGPTFSGALMLPKGQRGDLSPPQTPSHPGLILRWEAALEELRAFRQLPDKRVHGILEAFAEAIHRHMAATPTLQPLPVPRLQRFGGQDRRWDQVQTIFPFVPAAAGGPGDQMRPLDRQQSQLLYRSLQQSFPTRLHPAGGQRCLLGQPVPCGYRDGIPVSALRLSISARQVVDADRLGLAMIVDQARTVFEKTTWLAGEIRQSV